MKNNNCFRKFNRFQVPWAVDLSYGDKITKLLLINILANMKFLKTSANFSRTKKLLRGENITQI